MAVVEIVQNVDGTPGIHPDQQREEVHLFSDTRKDREIGWQNYRIGKPYILDGTVVYPFFINRDEVRKKGWICFALNPEIRQDPEIDERIFRVWFDFSDVDCLRRGTVEYLEIIGFSFPMLSEEQQRELNKKYRERILQVAKDSLL